MKILTSDCVATGAITGRMSGLPLTLANVKAKSMNKLGTEIKAVLQNTDCTEWRIGSFDFPSQELIFAAVYNSAEYCRFEGIKPDPLATEAGKFVLLGKSAEGTDAHSLLAKQFDIARSDSKTMGLSCLPLSSQAYSKTRGWVNGLSLEIGELVLGYNTKTGKLEYTPVEKVHSLNNQEVWAQQNKSRTLLSTLNHRWVTGGSYGSAKDFTLQIKTTNEIINSSNSKILHAAELTSSKQSLLTPNESRILTWLLTDGSWNFYNNCLNANIYQAKPIFKQQIKKLLIEENAYCSERVSNDTNKKMPVVSFRLKNSYVHALLKKCGQVGTAKKDFNFTAVIPLLNLKAIRACAYTIIKAEGYNGRKADGSFLIGQNKGHYADDIATVLFLAGFQITRHKKALQRTGNYAENIYAIKRRTSNTRWDKNFLHSVEDVWCITTPLSTFITRQVDGFITITGNCLYGAGQVSTCNLLRPSLGYKYTEKELKELVTNYIKYFKGTRGRGEYLWQGGLFSYFFNYAQWLISNPIPRLPFGQQAITNTLRPEYCGTDYYTSRMNWGVQATGSAMLDSAIYEIDKGIYEAGLENHIWYQFSCHDQIAHMCHESCIKEYAAIVRKAYKSIWTKFFAAFEMYCPEQVIQNLELTIDFIDRKAPNTSVNTISGKRFLSHIPEGVFI